MVWYSHLFQNFPQFIVVHTVKGFGIVNKAEIDHELLITKFRLKLKKVWKTTRPFRYDLSQIFYDYTVAMTNRFKGLDLIDRVLEELWMEIHYIVQEAGIKTIPKEKKYKKAKWLSEEALQIPDKRAKEKKKYLLECRVIRISR